MDRDKLIGYLGALTDAEFSQLAAEARGTNNQDIRQIILRELTRDPAPLTDADSTARHHLDN